MLEDKTKPEGEKGAIDPPDIRDPEDKSTLAPKDDQTKAPGAIDPPD